MAVQVWYGAVTELQKQEKYQEYYHRLPDFRKEKVKHLQKEQQKRQSVGVWQLLCDMRRAYGLGEETSYNLSHSGEYVACAVATGEKKEAVLAGCDIQEMKEEKYHVARAFLGKQELKYLENSPEAKKKQEVFYRYWVLKESLGKAVGCGLQFPLRECSFRLGEGEESVLVTCPKEMKRQWYFLEWCIEDRYRGAVCATQREIVLQKWEKTF